MEDSVAWRTAIRRAGPGTRPCSVEPRSQAEAAPRRICLGWGWTVFQIPSTPWVHGSRPIAYLRPGFGRAATGLVRLLGQEPEPGGRWPEDQCPGGAVRASVAQRTAAEVQGESATALLEDAGTLAAASSDSSSLRWRCQTPRCVRRKRKSSRCGQWARGTRPANGARAPPAPPAERRRRRRQGRRDASSVCSRC